jgi:amidase
VAFLPSTAFPVGLSSDGLPIGLQATCASYLDYQSIEVARLITEVVGGFEPPSGLT